MLTDIKQTSNEKYVNITGNIIDGKNGINLEFRKSPSFDSFDLNVKVSLVQTAEHNEFVLWNFNVSICQFLTNMDKHPMLKSLYMHAMEFGNFNDKCPFDKVILKYIFFLIFLNYFVGILFCQRNFTICEIMFWMKICFLHRYRKRILYPDSRVSWSRACRKRWLWPQLLFTGKLFPIKWTKQNNY